MNTLLNVNVSDYNKVLRLAYMYKYSDFVRSFEQEAYTNDEIRQSCDDLLTMMMKILFGVDWEDNEEAVAFYANTACDIRIKAENDAIQLYKTMKSK